MLAARFFSSSHNEDHEVAWSQNPTVYKTQQLLEEKEELGQTRFLITLFFTVVKFSLVQLVSPFSALKVILIYV